MMPPKLHHVALLALRERRAGEADVAGIREHLPHPRREHAQLRALGFIHQHENLGGFVLELARGQRLVELVNQRGDDVRLAIRHQFHQMPPRFGTIRRQAAGREGVAELLVEIDAVGDQHDARRADIKIEHQRLGQHHHRQRLARTLRVPDDAASPSPGIVALLDPTDDALDREKLLVTGNLAPPAIEYRKS